MQQSETGKSLQSHGPQVVALVVFVLSLWAQVPDAYVGTFLADGLNLVLAKALARGEGLVFIHLPGQPAAAWLHPLYPYAVSLVGRLWPHFPDNLVLIQIVDSAMLSGAAFVVTAHARRLPIRSVYVYTAVGAGFLSVQLLSLSVSAFVQPMLLMLLSAAVFVVDSFADSWKSAVVTGALLGAAALTADLGIICVAIICITLLLRRRYLSAAIVGVLCVVAWLPWALWSLRVSAEGSLGEAVSHIAVAARGGAPWWIGFGPLIELLLPNWPVAVVVVGGVIAIGFFIWACVKTFAQAPAVVMVTVLGPIGGWLLSSSPQRNIWVFFPWFVLLVTVGAVRVWGSLRATRIPTALAVFGLISLYVPRTMLSLATRQFASSGVAQHDNMQLLTRSISAELPEDAVIASDAEALIHLYTGHTVVPAVVPVSGGRLSDMTETYCRYDVTHVARSGLNHSFALTDAQMDSLGSSVTPLFRLTDGPSLYRFECPS